MTASARAAADALAALPMWKGHGTENDFVILDDRFDTVQLDAHTVRLLCDRRAGIGADGVLRVVDVAGAGALARWFMDYRNADGSVAEMCGNGARVFARYLYVAGLDAGPEIVLATRAGDVPVRLRNDGQVTVCLGPAGYLDVAPLVSVAGLEVARRGVGVVMPNPHVVVTLDTPDQLAALDLSLPPQLDSPLPDGQNVEFVVRLGERHLALRVHERGSGETRSCGTGIAAAVLAAQHGCVPNGEPWRVDVPGGTLGVRWTGTERVELTGSAVLVGRVQLDAEWLTTALTGTSALS